MAANNMGITVANQYNPVIGILQVHPAVFARNMKEQELSTPPNGKRKRPEGSRLYSEKQRKKVGFCLDPANGDIRKELVDSTWTLETITPLWWSRDEIRQMVRRNQQALDKLKDDNQSYIQSIVGLFQQCAAKSNAQDLVDANHKFLLNPPREDIRGLERRMHKMLSRYRAFHVRGLLKIQRDVIEKDLRESSLRSLSTKTSRVSRVMAQMLAFGDAIQVASMIRQELTMVQSAHG
jgi:hypothetical protein